MVQRLPEPARVYSAACSVVVCCCCLFDSPPSRSVPALPTAPSPLCLPQPPIQVNDRPHHARLASWGRPSPCGGGRAACAAARRRPRAPRPGRTDLALNRSRRGDSNPGPFITSVRRCRDIGVPEPYFATRSVLKSPQICGVRDIFRDTVFLADPRQLLRSESPQSAMQR